MEKEMKIMLRLYEIPFLVDTNDLSFVFFFIVLFFKTFSYNISELLFFYPFG